MGYPSFTPQLVHGGLALLDTNSGQVLQVISLQYNPDSLSRSLQIKGVGGDTADPGEALRLKGPPIETIKLEAEIDASDRMEVADPQTAQVGIQPQLAVLESLVYPTAAQLQANDAQAAAGVLEIAPVETPLALFIWSRNRIVPVRLTEFSITEEAFDVNLNPLRAKVSLSLRVLSVDDLGFENRGGSLFMSYLQQKEQLARRYAGGTLSALGLGG